MTPDTGKPRGTHRFIDLRVPSRRLTTLLAGLAAGALATGVALAASPQRVVGEAHNATLQRTIVVDVHGRALYVLHPETVHHLLCRSRSCLALWPPLTVRSSNVRLEAGHGVEGRLALLHRSDGKLQVTLRGLPLYRYAGDSSAGEANGQGIRSFGGTWHVLSPTNASPPPAAAPPAQAPPPMVPYGY
jgi:predicted lipoprotein with Yx(FWY)xxD motif